MTRVKDLIKSLIRPRRDFGSEIGVIQEVIRDLDRIFAELKASSDDLTVQEVPKLSVLLDLEAASQSFTTGVAASIGWSREVFDDGGWADLGADSTIITVPTGITRIEVICGVQWDISAVGDRQNSILKNGSTVVARVRYCATTGDFSAFTPLSTGMIDVVAGDTFELEGLQTSGGNLLFAGDGAFMSALAFDTP